MDGCPPIFAMTVSFEAQDDPDLGHVWTWLEYRIALISESRANVLRRLDSGFKIEPLACAWKAVAPKARPRLRAKRCLRYLT